MGQTVTAEVTAYNIRVTEMDEGYSDRFIEVFAVLSDSNGNEIGEVATDYFDIARNLPLALLKVYLLHRKIDKGTLDLELDI